MSTQHPGPRHLKLQPYVDKAGGHRWRLRARNGRIVATSGESYTTRSGLQRAMWRLAGAVILPEPPKA